MIHIQALFIHFFFDEKKTLRAIDSLFCSELFQSLWCDEKSEDHL